MATYPVFPTFSLATRSASQSIFRTKDTTPATVPSMVTGTATGVTGLPEILLMTTSPMFAVPAIALMK